MSQRVDKDSLALDKPRRTPGHPTKSHIVKTRVDGKEKIIRFGEQGASTAGKPKEGESERMKAKRASFKSRHAKNIDKGKSSPAYWANKVKWADGGPVELLDMAAKYDEGGDVDVMDYLRSVGGTFSSLPNVPAALYDVGKRAVQAAPEAARSAVQYIQRSTPQEVAQDVRGGLSAAGRQVRDNPLSTIADFIPVVGDIKAYGEDVARAAAMRARGDVRGAQGVEQFAIPMAMASILPGVGEARKAVKAADEAGPLLKMMEQEVAPIGIKTGAKAEFPVRFGVPQGGVNLRPSVDPVTLKGPDVQTVESFVNQLRGQPGITKQGLQNLLAAYEDPSEVMTKAKFGERIPGSQYDIVDLKNSAEGADAHLLQEATNYVNQDRMEVFARTAENMGMDYRQARFLQEIYDEGFNPTDLHHAEIAELVRSRYPGQNIDVDDIITDTYRENYENAVTAAFENYAALENQGGLIGEYTYGDYQRLVRGNDPEGYFEIGVTNPNVTDKYKHFPGKKNLAGHIRGTLMGEYPTNILSGIRSYGDRSPDPTYQGFLFGTAVRAFDFKPKPNSLVIEELQSDVQKGVEATGPLHQIHATLFKSAIQDAIEQGANTVYLPTAKAIGIARFEEPDSYASIYDKEVIKYGLNPLKEIPGVEVNPINDMYYEINFAPEAKDYILKGKGQKAPGFAEGGEVDVEDKTFAFDINQINDIVKSVMEPKRVGDLTLTPQYRPGGRPDLDVEYATKVGPADVRMRKSLRGGADYDVNVPFLGGDLGLGASADVGFTPKRARVTYRRNFAKGGFVEYDPKAIDDIVTQIHEGMYG